MNALNDWARRWGIDRRALAELGKLLANPVDVPADPSDKSETAAQQEVRLMAPKFGGHLWRNNVGAFNDDDGVPVRYGLANDSSKLNKKVKSSDLIGFLPYECTAADVGRTIAVFTAIECKRANWYWSASVRERAQRRFINIVLAGGGVAGFARGADDLLEIVAKHGS